MKKALLASTALVGAALLTAPAQAGTVGSGDNLSLNLSGFYWFNVAFYDEDNSNTRGRGYRFDSPESEIYVNASNTADNGIQYGVSIELNADTNDGTAADETWAYLDSDSFGRVELGDQDDAANRMMIGGWNANKGAGGLFGGLGTLGHLQGTLSAATEVFLTDRAWQNQTTSDSTKAIYFTPRFNGFQLGASWTPDSGNNGFEREADNDGSYENVLSLGANYVGNFDNVRFTVAAVGQWGDDETTTGAEAANDLDVWTIGARVDFNQFTVGGSFTDAGDSGRTATNGGDQQMWDLGLGYSQGPWGVSVGYGYGERDNGTASAVDTEVTRLHFGASYSVAPGWQLTGDLEFAETENVGTTTTDRDGRLFMIGNRFFF